MALAPVAEAFAKAGFGPRGDLWSVINGSRMLTALRAPGQLDTRWLTEDLPYGLAMWTRSWSGRGEMLIARSLITLGSALLGRVRRRRPRPCGDRDRHPVARVTQALPADRGEAQRRRWSGSGFGGLGGLFVTTACSRHLPGPSRSASRRSL